MLDSPSDSICEVFLDLKSKTPGLILQSAWRFFRCCQTINCYNEPFNDCTSKHKLNTKPARASAEKFPEGGNGKNKMEK